MRKQIIYREGDPTQIADLYATGVHRASGICILTSDRVRPLRLSPEGLQYSVGYMRLLLSSHLMYDASAIMLVSNVFVRIQMSQTRSMQEQRYKLAKLTQVQTL